MRCITLRIVGCMFCEGMGHRNLYSSPNNLALAWTTQASTVVSGVTYQANVGARMVSDGTNLYATMGDGETAFLKYNTAGNPL